MRVDDFEPVYAGNAKGTPALKISMTFTLVSLEKNKIATIFILKEDGQASDNSLTAIASGLQSLAQRLMGEAFQKIAPEIRPARSNARRG